MSTELTEAASLLLAARQQDQAVVLPSWQPANNAQAYAIQAQVSQALGAVAGWKTGAPAPAAPAIAAPLPAHRVWPSPATLGPDGFHLRGIELEVAFLLGQDLPPREQAYSADEVLAAVSSAHAAIEVVESRFTDMTKVPPLWKLADHQCNGGFVSGSGTSDWQKLDLATIAVELRVNGQVAVSCDGGNPVGDPRHLLAFLANHCRAREGLKAGNWITTGSYTGIVPVAADATVQGTVAGIGDVYVQFSKQ